MNNYRDITSDSAPKKAVIREFERALKDHNLELADSIRKNNLGTDWDTVESDYRHKEGIKETRQ